MKELGYVIEEMRPENAEAARDLFVTVMLDRYGSLFGEETREKLRERYDSQDFSDTMSSHLTPGPDAGLFVARLQDDDTIVGFAKAGIHDDKHWMDFAVVDPRYRRRGIGEALFRRRLLWHDEKDLNADIFLQVVVGNPAWSLHVRHGFEHVNYYQDKATGLWKETMKLPAARRRISRN